MEIKNNNVKKVSIISLISNFILLCLKLCISLISNSQAMLADTLNSAGDIVASIFSYIGAKVSSKPQDLEHPHGHGKAEYVFTTIISLCMIVASITMINSSLTSIILNKTFTFSLNLVFICIITIAVKICLFIYTKMELKKKYSILIKATSEDHRNDIFVTIGTLIGILCSSFGFNFMDGVIGIITSIWIIYVGINLFLSSYKVLMDTSLDKSEEKKIIEFVENSDEILHVDSLISKPIGQNYIVIVKLSMDGKLTLEHSHKIIGKIKDDLVKKFEYIHDVVIHINPH